MARDWLKGVQDEYDIVVIGSGLGGLTAANTLAKCGHRILLLEHHYQFGGLATWFRRKGGHVFDISLHGFPMGMIKSCRRYWNAEIADRIVQLKDVRFKNPQYDITTTFDREDFTRLLIERFGQTREIVEGFFTHLRSLNYYDNDRRTTGELFEQFFPGRKDIHRLLMEPISYANGSSTEDPAITFGIVFSNFMSKGVYTFQGGTDLMIDIMATELEKNGVDLRKCANVEQIYTEPGPGGKPRVRGVRVNGRDIRCKAVISNANIKNTILKLLPSEAVSPALRAETEAVRLNYSSCQVYMGIKKGESLPHIGDLIFTSDAPEFSMVELTHFHTTSRTFSVYYPETRPHLKEPRYAVVASINALWKDWADLPEDAYQQHKARICEQAVEALERIVPGVREKIDHLEAATPRTVHFYTRHFGGTSFGTKFEGLKVSQELPDHVHGLYHAGSVGIIMSGWLGTINYGVITANRVDKEVREFKRAAA